MIKDDVSMVEPSSELNNLIEEAKKSIEKDDFDSAINLYRKVILEFLWIVRSIKIIDNVTIIDNIFTFCNKLRNIFRTLRDSESIMLIDRFQDSNSLYDLINKIPSDKPMVTKRIYGWTSYLQKYGVEKPTPYIMENPVRHLIEKEKRFIFKSSEESRKPSGAI